MTLPTTNLVAHFDSTSGVTITGSGVSQWNDLSGQGNHATQTTDGYRPTVRTIDGVDYLEFDGSQSMAFPAIGGDSTDFCFFMVMEPDHYNRASNVIPLNLYGSSDNLNALQNDAAGSSRLKVKNITSSIRYGSSLMAYGCNSGAGGTTLFIGAESEALGVMTASAFDAGSEIGALNGPQYFWTGLVRALFVYDAEQSAEDIAAIRAHISDTYGAVSTTETRLLVFDGDSLTSAGAAPYEGHAEQVARSYDTQPKCVNVAVGGQSLSTMATMGVAVFDPELTRNAAYTNQTAILWGGTNDIVGGATLQDLQDDATAWIAGRKAAGAKTVILTIIPRSDNSGAAELVRQAFNAWIVTGASGADVVCDVAADARLQDPTDLTYFKDDEVHLIAAGHEVVAGYVRTAIDAAEEPDTVTTYYVDPASGSDSNDGLSESGAFATWTKANSVHGPGDTVSIRCGTNSTETTTIEPADSSIWNTYGTGASPQLVNTADKCFSLDAVENVTIEGIDVESEVGIGFQVLAGCDGLTMIDCTAHDCVNDVGGAGTGFRCTGQAGDVYTLTGCTATDNEDDGFDMFGAGKLIATNCTASGHLVGANADGFSCHDGAAMEMYYCTSTGNRDGVHHVNTSGANVIEGCTITANTNYGLNLAPAGASTATNKVINNVIRDEYLKTDLASNGVAAGACVYLPTHSEIHGGYNTLVSTNTHATEFSSCYQLAGTGSIDMVGDLMIAHPTSASALYVITDGAKTVVNFGDHDFGEITSNTLRFTALGTPYTTETWLTFSSTGGRIVANDLDAFGVAFEAADVNLTEASTSARVNATAAFTDRDFAGRPRVAGSYSRGAMEPNTPTSVTNISVTSDQTHTITAREN